METWTWLGAYLIGFILLQVYLYRYFMKRSSTSESGGATTESGRTAAESGRTAAESGRTAAESGRTATGGSGVPVESDDDHSHTKSRVKNVDIDHTSDLGPPGDLSVDDAVRCDECGAYNEREQMFRYCRNCGEKL